jgi:hypothetical protein
LGVFFSTLLEGWSRSFRHYWCLKKGLLRQNLCLGRLRMQKKDAGRETLYPPVQGERQATALYVYCVSPTDNGVSPDGPGLEDSPVYAVPLRELCALVHDCPPQPYQSRDSQTAEAWVLAHHQVVHAAWKRWGAVVPLAFNTILMPGSESTAGENLKVWLAKERESLKAKLDTFQGKAEYGVQVFWDPAILGKQTAQGSPEIRRLEEKVISMSPGLAYLHRQRMERLLKRELEAWAAAEFTDLYRRVSRCVESIRVDKTKVAGTGQQMLLNLSCLVSMHRYLDLEAELAAHCQREGISFRLAGPLPPYSFC